MRPRQGVHHTLQSKYIVENDRNFLEKEKQEKRSIKCNRVLECDFANLITIRKNLIKSEKYLDHGCSLYCDFFMINRSAKLKANFAVIREL